MKKMKKALSLLLVLSMVLSMSFTSAFASEGSGIGHEHNQDGWNCVYTEGSSERCYDENGDLTCDIEEHTHGDNCYTVTEGTWTCTPPATEGETGTEDGTGTESEAETPAEVKAFLDAVAAIPADIKADNAEVAGELVNAAFDAYEALVDAGLDEYAGVADALAAVEAAYAAIDEALDMESAVYANAKLNKTIDAGSVTKYVGEDGYYQRLPRNTFICRSCGNVAAEYIPGWDEYSSYSNVRFDNEFLYSGENDIKVGSYKSGAAPGDYIYKGYPCFEVDYKVIKPGISTVNAQPYYWFNVAADAGYCDYCWVYVTIPSDYNLYYDNISFTVKGVTDYTVTYTGEGVTLYSQTVGSKIADISHSFTAASAPTREGYTFKGWQYSGDGKIYDAGSSVTMNWEESDGRNVQETMTAVWEKDDGTQDTKYKIVREYRIDNEKVATVTGSQNGKVGDVIVGATLAENNPKWNSRTIDGKTVTFEYKGCEPTPFLTLDATGTQIITLLYVKNTITGIEKDLVKEAGDVPSDVADTLGGNDVTITYPNSNGKVIIPKDGSVTLLYKITVTGEVGAAYKVVDESANFLNGDSEGTIPEGGEAVIYVTKTFDEKDITDGKLSNTATVTPGKDGESSTSSTETTPAEEETPAPVPPTIKVEKENDGFHVNPQTGNATVNYTVKVTNTSDKTLYGLRLTDIMDEPTLTKVNAADEGTPAVKLTFSNWEVKTTKDSESLGITPMSGGENDLTHVLQLLTRNTEFESGQTVTLTYTVEIENLNDEIAINVKLDNTATGGAWSKVSSIPTPANFVMFRAAAAFSDDEPDVSGSDSSSATTGSDTDDPDVTDNGGSTAGGNTGESGTEGTLPAKYTVTYTWTGLPDGATEVLPREEKYPAKANVTVDKKYAQGTEITVGEGENVKKYVFSGWSDGDFEMPNHNVNITGRWIEVVPDEHIVSYTWTGLPAGHGQVLPEGGSYAEGAPVIVNDSFNSNTTATVDGTTYQFSGWDRGDFTMGTEDVEISGTWRAVSVNYTIVHEYYTNGSLSGSTSSGLTDAVGTTVNAADIAKVNTYDGNTYNYTSASPESVTLAAGGNYTITLRYDRTTGGGGGYIPPTTDPTDPTNPINPDEPTVDIDDPDTPLGPGPDEPEEPDVEIDEPDTPLAGNPDEDNADAEIDDEDVPLAGAPKTGDDFQLWTWIALVMTSGAGLAWLALADRKRRNTVK